MNVRICSAPPGVANIAAMPVAPSGAGAAALVCMLGVVLVAAKLARSSRSAGSESEPLLSQDAFPLEADGMQA